MFKDFSEFFLAFNYSQRFEGSGDFYQILVLAHHHDNVFTWRSPCPELIMDLPHHSSLRYAFQQSGCNDLLPVCQDSRILNVCLPGAG
jgi:hypothetical protein